MAAGNSSSRLSARILKLMSIFSGLQMLGIVCSVIKMKLVALWLGTWGVGLFGIYQSVVDTIATFTDMGIRQSSVRDIAREHAGSRRIAVITAVVRRWSLFSGLLGAGVIAALAVPLGLWFFGSVSGCWGFLLLSSAMFLNAVCGGEQALLQGSDKLKALASANLQGTVGGLVISIPLFYFCGSTGVVLSIVAYAVTLSIALYFKRSRTDNPSPALGLGQIWKEGKGFVRLGLYMAVAAFITSLAHTIFIGLLNQISSTEEVGLVQAGDTLVVRYIGMVFIAIGMEFYPRVAAAANHRSRLRVFVNHEITLLMLILLPLLMLFILFRVPVIEILYSKEFYPVIPFVSWAALSSVPKAVSWCMAYTIVAKGDGRIYILTEGLDALISVPLCLVAYSLYGLTGLGVAYILWYILYMLLTGIVYYRRYGLRLSRHAITLSAMVFVGAVIFLVGVDTLSAWMMAPVAAGVSVPCLIELRKMVRR